MCPQSVSGQALRGELEQALKTYGRHCTKTELLKLILASVQLAIEAQENTTLVREEVADAERRCEESFNWSEH